LLVNMAAIGMLMNIGSTGRRAIVTKRRRGHAAQ
jgi:hypothetical protein